MNNSRLKCCRILNGPRLTKQESLNFSGSAYVIRSRKPGCESNNASGETDRNISRLSSCCLLRSQKPLSSFSRRATSHVHLSRWPFLPFLLYNPVLSSYVHPLAVLALSECFLLPSLSSLQNQQKLSSFHVLLT